MTLTELLGPDLPLDEVQHVEPYDELCQALSHPTDHEDVVMEDGTRVGACWCRENARPIKSQREYDL